MHASSSSVSGVIDLSFSDDDLSIEHEKSITYAEDYRDVILNANHFHNRFGDDYDDRIDGLLLLRFQPIFRTYKEMRV